MVNHAAHERVTRLELLSLIEQYNKFHPKSPIQASLPTEVEYRDLQIINTSDDTKYIRIIDNFMRYLWASKQSYSRKRECDNSPRPWIKLAESANDLLAVAEKMKKEFESSVGLNRTEKQNMRDGRDGRDDGMQDGGSNQRGEKRQDGREQKKESMKPRFGKRIVDGLKAIKSQQNLRFQAKPHVKSPAPPPHHGILQVPKNPALKQIKSPVHTEDLRGFEPSQYSAIVQAQQRKEVQDKLRAGAPSQERLSSPRLSPKKDMPKSNSEKRHSRENSPNTPQDAPKLPGYLPQPSPASVESGELKVDGDMGTMDLETKKKIDSANNAKVVADALASEVRKY